MEIGSCSSSLGNCNRDMERLAEAFGSSMSLEVIASAYNQAELNVDQAGVILYELQGTASAMSKDVKDTQGQASMLPEQSSEGPSDSVSAVGGNAADAPPNVIVSGIAAGDYVRSAVSADRYSRTENSEKALSGNAKVDGILENVGEFLFKMLGDGFQLDMEKIHDVLGVCGYDLEKSMETLVDMSASALEKSDDIVSTSCESEEYQEIRTFSCYQKPQLADNPGPRLVKKNGKEQHKKGKDNSNLQREILGALFSAPERIEEQPKKLMPRTRVSRSNAYGIPVAVPLKETKIDRSFVAVQPLAALKVEDEEDGSNFMALRQAVKEYWVTMKGYYKAAADAYINGDTERAFKLMKEGQFFNKKAREADEKSAQLLLETREDEILLDFSTFEPREAIKILKLHLSNLAGIPSIRYLKVNVGSDAQSKKGARKRHVLKLLGKESIKWSESDNGEIIAIQLDEINHKTLSFARKEDPSL